MSAVERYQSYVQTWSDPKYDNDMAHIDLVRNMLSVSDAAIEELEAEVSRIKTPNWLGDKNIRVSKEFAELCWTRDDKCNRISIEWGEPDRDGFHTPVFTTHYEDNPLVEAEARISELEHPKPIHKEFPFECPNCGLKANLTIDVTPRR